MGFSPKFFIALILWLLMLTDVRLLKILLCWKLSALQLAQPQGRTQDKRAGGPGVSWWLYQPHSNKRNAGFPGILLSHSSKLHLLPMQDIEFLFFN